MGFHDSTVPGKRALSQAPGVDCAGSAGTAFLGIRAVFADKTGFLQVYGAAGCPIYDLFLVAN